MKKVILIIALGIFLVGCQGCGNKKTLGDKLMEVNNQVIDFCLADHSRCSNLVGNYVDLENGVVVIELEVNSKEEQETFKEHVVDSKYLKFVQKKANSNN